MIHERNGSKINVVSYDRFNAMSIEEKKSEIKGYVYVTSYHDCLYFHESYKSIDEDCKNIKAIVDFDNGTLISVNYSDIVPVTFSHWSEDPSLIEGFDTLSVNADMFSKFVVNFHKSFENATIEPISVKFKKDKSNGAYLRFDYLINGRMEWLHVKSPSTWY